MVVNRLLNFFLQISDALPQKDLELWGDWFSLFDLVIFLIKMRF